MMFSFISDAVENALDIGESLLDGDLPTNRQIANLVEAGVSLYAISEITGVATDVLEKMLED